MADVKNGSGTPQETARSKERAPSYPSLTLTDAIKLANDLWDKEKRTAVPQDVAVRAWGYKGLSGPARSTLGTLRQYGLLESDKRGVRLSELALEILHQPPGSQERANALHTAALKPKLFSDLVETHLEASDDNLRAYLLTRLSFSEDGARRFIRAFRDATALANLQASGYNQQSMPVTNTEALSNQPDLGGVIQKAFGRPKVTLFSWPLSRGLTAEVRFVGEDVQPAHLELLSKYLELAKNAVGTEATPTKTDET